MPEITKPYAGMVRGYKEFTRTVIGAPVPTYPWATRACLIIQRESGAEELVAALEDSICLLESLARNDDEGQIRQQIKDNEAALVNFTGEKQ